MSAWRYQSSVVTGFFARAGVQALVFFLVAKSLGVESFGQFTAAVALAGLCSPLALAGVDQFLLSRLSQDDTALDWLFGLHVTAFLYMVPIVLLIGYLLSLLSIFDGLHTGYFLLVFFAECLLVRVNELFGRIVQVRGDFLGVVGPRIGLACTRLAACGCWVLAAPTVAVGWWLGYFLATVLWVAIMFSIVVQRYCVSPSRQRIGYAELKEMLPFAFSGWSDRARTEIDKPLLASFGNNAELGIYAVASRIVEFLSMPLLALISVMQPAWMSRSARGERTVAAGERRVLFALAAALALVGCGLIVFGDLIPRFFGDEYVRVTELLPLMLLIPVLVVSRTVVVSVLYARQQQRSAALLYALALAAAVIVGVCFVPAWGAWASVAGALTGELLVVIGGATVLSKRRAVTARSVE
jgi:O-antigen/teichoic acid export membrane protein